MRNDNNYSFTDALSYFTEDGQLERSAREIIEREQRKQQYGSGQQGRCPFTILDHCTKEEDAILAQYFQSQREQAKEQARRSSVKTEGQPDAQPPFSGTSPVGSIVQTIRSMISPKKSKSDAEGPTTYDMMCALLAQVHLVVYEGHFYYRDGAVFKLMDEANLQRLLFRFLESFLAEGRSQRIIDGVIDLLKKNPWICVSHTTEAPDRVFFLNGAYHLSRHELTSLWPTDFFTSYMPIYYLPEDTSCPCFDRYLQSVSGGNPAVKRLIWEVLGYLLSYDTAAKAFFVLQGVGDSGKSVFGNLVASFFNEESLAHLDIYRFKDRFSTSALKGKRLNICMDLPRNKISREAIGVIKMLTGDDTITIEEKFQKSESDKPACKLLFGSNFPLMPADHDAAFQARLVTIPFLYSIPKEQQDKHLLEKLMAERSAIAVKALDYYLRLKANNYCFTKVDVSVAAVIGYVPDSEVLQAFLEQSCVFAPGEFTFTEDLYSAYNRFRVAYNVPPASDSNTFSRQLNRYCAGRISSKKRRKGEQSLNGYEGIGLRPSIENGPSPNIVEGGNHQ